MDYLEIWDMLKEFISELRKYPLVSKRHSRYVYLFETDKTDPSIMISLAFHECVLKKFGNKLIYNDANALMQATLNYELEMFVFKTLIVFVKVKKITTPEDLFSKLDSEIKRRDSLFINLHNENFILKAKPEIIESMQSKYDYHCSRVHSLAILCSIQNVVLPLFFKCLGLFESLRKMMDYIEYIREGKTKASLYSKEWFDVVYNPIITNDDLVELFKIKSNSTLLIFKKYIENKIVDTHNFIWETNEKIGQWILTGYRAEPLVQTTGKVRKMSVYKKENSRWVLLNTHEFTGSGKTQKQKLLKKYESIKDHLRFTIER